MLQQPLAAGLPDYSVERLTYLHQKVNKALGDFVTANMPALSRRMITPGFYRRVFEFVIRPSKRLRPLLFLLAYEAFSDLSDLETPELLAVATSLELAHAAILIHDDIIDSSDKRGTMPSLHKCLEAEDFAQDSISAALLAGDALFMLAMLPTATVTLDEAIKASLLAELADSTAKTAEGQTDELYVSNKCIADITGDLVHSVYRLKTGSTSVECPIMMGLIMAGGDSEAMRGVLRPWCATIGTAFQIMNDLVGYRRQLAHPDEKGGDFGTRKKTMLVKLAWSLASEMQRMSLQRFFDGRTAGVEIADVIDIVEATGVVKVAETMVDDLFGEARSIIENSNLASGLKSRLAHLGDLLSRLYQPGSPYQHLAKSAS